MSQKELFQDSLETQKLLCIKFNHLNEWLASAVNSGIIALNIISESGTANVFAQSFGGAA